MANKDLLLKPIPIRPSGDNQRCGGWFYEEARGLCVVAENDRSGSPQIVGYITWARIREALERKDRT